MGHAVLQQEPYVLVEDYLAAEAEREVRHEYAYGRVYAMAGADLTHNVIKDNLSGELRQRLRARGCRVVTSDQRVRVGRSYRYPDVVVVCGGGTLDGERPESLLDPDLLAEVTSPSTADRDRKEKLEEYVQIPSLQEYWIVEPDQPLVTQYLRRGDAWEVRFVRGLDGAVESTHFGITVPMGDVYALVDLPEPPAPPEESAM